MKNKIIISIVFIISCILSSIILNPLINNLHKSILENRVIYKVKIENEFINLRSSIDLSNDPIMKVYKDEIFDVVEYYEGNTFNWYRIIYNGNETGWIASGKSKSWVSVINSESEDGEQQC